VNITLKNITIHYEPAYSLVKGEVIPQINQAQSRIVTAILLALYVERLYLCKNSMPPTSLTAHACFSTININFRYSLRRTQTQIFNLLVNIQQMLTLK
jgi:sulfur relay (sulfurtransferase) DsrF/TusC family protein